MAYDPQLADRISQMLRERNVVSEEKEMMGGITWMVDDKMCVGIFRGNLMARIDPAQSEYYLSRPATQQMEMSGRIMKGYIHVLPEGYDRDEDLAFWVDHCLAFNPKAKASKPKKKKVKK